MTASYIEAIRATPDEHRSLNDQIILALVAEMDGLFEQKEAADRVLTVADQLADWVRVTVSVAGVFSNNRGAQAQAQGLANLLTRYAATRDSYPAPERQDA